MPRLGIATAVVGEYVRPLVHTYVCPLQHSQAKQTFITVGVLLLTFFFRVLHPVFIDDNGHRSREPSGYEPHCGGYAIQDSLRDAFEPHCGYVNAYERFGSNTGNAEKKARTKIQYIVW